MNIGRGSRYKVTSPPDDPALSEMEQIDAIIERSVTFEITEAHHDNIGLKEIDLDGEMSGGDIRGRWWPVSKWTPCQQSKDTPGGRQDRN